jgi:hypothetical protein
VEAPVQRVIVLIPTQWAHGEVFHCGAGSIIGYALDDGVSGAAVRTVQKGIVMTPIVEIKEFTQTLVASADIGADDGRI